MGLLAEPEPVIASSESPRRVSAHGSGGRGWPSYWIALSKAPLNKEGDGPDRSIADHRWAATAYDWDRSKTAEQIANKLLAVTAKARECRDAGDHGYATVTARNAIAYVEARQRSRA